MKKLLILLIAPFLITGCASQGTRFVPDNRSDAKLTSDGVRDSQATSDQNARNDRAQRDHPAEWWTG